MKSLTIIAAIALVITSCSKSSIKGGGATVTETRTVSSFSGVRIEGSAKATVVQGTQQKVEVSGYENLVPVYRTFVSGGVLVLKFDDQYYNIRNNNIEVNIVVPNLEYCSINGSGEIHFSNFTGSSIEAEVNGSGDIYTANNTYSASRLVINGSGYIRGREINTASAVARISGSGKIDVTCSTKLEANISGSGEINYWGQPTTIDTQISGSGKVNKKL